MSAATDLARVFCVKLERPLRVDSVEKVTSPKSLQICQNTNDIFD
jgi:hypothetical protein